jgi:hypothetical protein
MEEGMETGNFSPGRRLPIKLMFTVMVMFPMILFVIVTPAGAVAALVDYVSGDVRYRHLKEEWEPLEVGMNILSGDMIETGTNSEAVLLDGDSEIYLSENTSFTLTERYEKEQKRSTFLLFLGRMRYKLGKTGEAEPDIQTQTVNLTIRGTEFEVGSGYDGSTIVLIEEGSVAVQGRTRELLLLEGEGTEVAFGEEPTEKFEVMKRVIDWSDWLSGSQDAVAGNETALLGRIESRFEGISRDIGEFERIREESLQKRDSFMEKRDELLEDGKSEEAKEMSSQAGEESKRAFHALVNIRFLALSSIGLYDLAENVHSGLEEPTTEQDALFERIKSIYSGIESTYVLEGDRERLEGRAEKKKGCLNTL